MSRRGRNYRYRRRRRAFLACLPAILSTITPFGVFRCIAHPYSDFEIKHTRTKNENTP